MAEIDLRSIHLNTAALLDEACRSAGGRTLLEFPSRGFKTSYGEFRAQVNRIANLLAALP